VHPKPLERTIDFAVAKEDLFAYPESLAIIVPIPQPVLQLLGSPSEIMFIQEVYFQSIHGWMPIISKRLLHKEWNNHQIEPRADLALLILCMKLVTSVPDPASSSSMRTKLYSIAKGLHRLIESSGRYSTHFLQSGLLITMYELGHAIYPEAQASVAKNARLGMELGIHDICNQKMNPAPVSWAEEEERNRTWWGVVILDRYVQM